MTLGMKPTGRTRHRIEERGWFRRRHTLVLQIEVDGYEMDCIAGCVDRVYRRYWRDATVYDVTLNGEARK